MKIDIKEIEKVSLGPNEYLWITFDSNISQEQISNMANNMTKILPQELVRKIVFGPDSLHLKKIDFSEQSEILK